MRGTSNQKLTLDSKSSWSNLPYASMPFCVGVFLIAFPWMTPVSPMMTAPIMIPFGIVWIVAAVCINGYHSELILDPNSEEVVYRTSLVLHSWSNRAQKDNVKRVVLSQQDGRYRFVMEVEEGEDLIVTTFDYWRSREWSAQVAHFLGKPLIDTCRGEEEVLGGTLGQSILDQQTSVPKFSEQPPGRIEYTYLGPGKAEISIPRRRLFKSSMPRFGLGAIVVVAATINSILWPAWSIWFLIPGVLLALWAWYRPVAQMTHTEHVRISPNGLMMTISVFGRSKQTSFATHQIADITVVKGTDARFEHDDFDRHAVCVEGLDRHVQLGANLPKLEQVQWLQKALLGSLLEGQDRGV